jgi:hypothetical protein
MTTIFLIVFGFVFYRLLLSPLRLINSGLNRPDMNFVNNVKQQYHSEHAAETSAFSQKYKRHTKGFKGGEYIDFEEL